MKIFLIGAEGQIGNQIKKLYDDKLFELVYFNRHDLDITDFNKVKLLINRHKPNILVNAAAYTNVQQAESNSELADKINHLAIINLVNLCNDQKILLIHISTDYVFDGKVNIPYKENDATNPLNIYGKTKRDGENKIIDNSKLFIILRTSWVFSDSPNNFVSKIQEKIKNEKMIEVVSDQYGCPTSANSIANCILSISKYYLVKKEVKSGIYHYCGMPDTTWYIFATEILNKLKNFNQSLSKKIILPIKSNNLETNVLRPTFTKLNCKKIKAVFDIDQSDWRKDLEKLNLENIYND